MDGQHLQAMLKVILLYLRAVYCLPYKLETNYKKRKPQNALQHLGSIILMAEGQGFEPWVGYKPTPVFKTGALNHSATLPLRRKLYIGFSDQQYTIRKKTYIAAIFLII